MWLKQSRGELSEIPEAQLNMIASTERLVFMSRDDETSPVTIRAGLHTQLSVVR
jgi:hypothetical protein